MTIEEAKNILINRGFVEINGDYVFDGDKWRNAIAVISKWLEQQPCDDYISRQAVLDGLASIAKVKARSDAQKSLMGRVIFFVEQLPPVTPKEKTGHWIRGGYDDMYYVCSKCDYKATEYWLKPSYKHCPNCGAKMVEPQESEVNNEDSD